MGGNATKTSATYVLDSVLARPAGTARLAVVPSIPGAIADLRAWLSESEREVRLVSDVFDRLPPSDSLLSIIIDHLAQVALALWPDWQDGSTIPLDAGPESPGTAARVEDPAPLSAGRRGVSPSWMKSARRLCQAGKSPLPRGFGRTAHASQLALSIGPRGLIIALCVVDRDPPSGRLLGLARVAEWLARETSARLLVLVPVGLEASGELDAINFDPIPWPSPIGPGVAQLHDDWAPRVWPILGRPHPDSPGEQALARRLASDRELGGLFTFNVYARARSENRYLVDLLWADGKIVVEVDGYLYHHDRGSFSRDRRRDYELLVSGHLVLRLPHDEVVDDVELAVEKIRDVVRFRRGQDHPRDRTPDHDHRT